MYPRKCMLGYIPTPSLRWSGAQGIHIMHASKPCASEQLLALTTVPVCSQRVVLLVTLSLDTAARCDL